MHEDVCLIPQPHSIAREIIVSKPSAFQTFRNLLSDSADFQKLGDVFLIAL